jgi:hypothetical protein
MRRLLVVSAVAAALALTTSAATAAPPIPPPDPCDYVDCPPPTNLPSCSASSSIDSAWGQIGSPVDIEATLGAWGYSYCPRFMDIEPQVFGTTMMLVGTVIPSLESQPCTGIFSCRSAAGYIGLYAPVVEVVVQAWTPDGGSLPYTDTQYYYYSW